MPINNDFVHLRLPLKVADKAYFRRPSVPPKTQTAQNLQNRQLHGNSLKKGATQLSRFWQERQLERSQQNLPTITGGIPFVLQIDPSTDVDFLRGMGFEIVCDIEDGFVVVASADTDLTQFINKVDDFIRNKQRSGSPAKVYALCSDDDRLKRILSPLLHQTWSELSDSEVYTVDISIECNGLNAPPHAPDRNDNESDASYFLRIETQKKDFFTRIDNIAREREVQLEEIVTAHDGTFLTSFIQLTDSFTARISIRGSGLRDLVLNYPYIFEVTECEKINIETLSQNAVLATEDLMILPPEENSPIIGIIDSGIQENHKYLAPAVLQVDSTCLVPGQTSTNDDVSNGGHGTRVAGAALYHNSIPESGTFVLPYFIRNAKVLDGNNGMPFDLNPSTAISEIVNKFYNDVEHKTKIFNHSIGEHKPFCDFKHMSTWAAQIDTVSYDYDVLFIQAAGNISDNIINAYIMAGYEYPHYFERELARLSNPAQSLQAITVGSISHSDFETHDYIAIGKKGEISSFSRIGPGMWDSIKPDLVEYGGTHAKNKSDNTLTTPEEVCTDLLRRSPEGPAHARDGIGTSFAAPKIAHIAAGIQKILPNASALLYRALLVQSAKFPLDTSSLSKEEKTTLMRKMGYGIPTLETATQNSEYRVTLITDQHSEIGSGEAHIYSIQIPDALRNIGEDFNILVEITLSYAAKPRRTRRGVKKYMSTWLDWICSRIGETEEIFRKRIFETDASIQDDGAFKKWFVGEQNNWGDVKGLSRKGQTIQKDWCMVPSSQLTDAFCIAVRGHKGWGTLFRAKYALAVSFEAVNEDIEIYEHIRVANELTVEEIGSNEIRINVEGNGENI